MKIQRFVLCSAVTLAAFGASVGLLEIVRWLGAFSEPLKIKFETPVFTLPPRVEFKPADFVDKPANVEPVEEYEWSETGDYYFAGKTPKGFENFGSLSIVTREWNYDRDRFVAVEPSGSIQARQGTKYLDYQFSAININGKRVSIVTQSVKGISYQFDGKFVEEKLEYKNAAGMEIIDEVVLKGRLTKWRNGKKIADAKVNFEVGGC